MFSYNLLFDQNTDVNPHGSEYENERRESKKNTSRPKSLKSPRHNMDWEGPDVGRPRPESRGDSEFARHGFMVCSRFL